MIPAMPFWKLKKKKKNPPLIHFTILPAYLIIPFMQNLEIMKVRGPIFFFTVEI